MKTIFYLITFLISFHSINAQTKYKEVHINTSFKGNDHLLKLSESLLLAAKEGKISLYYPTEKEKKTTFEALAFQVRDWSYSTFEPEESVCHAEYVAQLIGELFNVSYILFYDESNLMDENPIPKYLQFVANSDILEYSYTVYGPVFHVEELVNTNVPIIGTSFFVKDIITNRMFQGYTVDDFGRNSPFYTDKQKSSMY